MEFDEEAMHELVLGGHFEEIWKDFGGARVKLYRMIGSHSIRIKLCDGRMLVFAYYSPDEWVLGENTLYDPAASKRKRSAKKHDYGRTGSDVYASEYPFISHQAIREQFEKLFPKLAEETVSITPNGSRSILASAPDGKKLVFAYYAPNKWSVGSTLADGDNIRSRMNNVGAAQED